ncbi:hypothetical protein PHJA_002526600 [Phtheirospermum japonicum]|uniref:Uncharacterized protein n=1 Tax=Phtheirospermum japonicum TaxID=374723 RepID=A0A830CTD0_9LAMI|nr:hypothetical protein PHJA_002526600 [Phtheirospermum japonicum]
MGISSSSHATTRQLGGTTTLIPISAKVVSIDGRLEEFRRLTTTAEVVSGHPDCYLCSSDTMVINSTAPQLPKDHVLQFGQIYFLMPLSKLKTPLSLQDLCVLAIKASIVIGNNSMPFMDGYKRLGCKDIVKSRAANSGQFRLRGSRLRVFVPCRKLSSRKMIRSFAKL